MMKSNSPTETKKIKTSRTEPSNEKLPSGIHVFVGRSWTIVPLLGLSNPAPLRVVVSYLFIVTSKAFQITIGQRVQMSSVCLAFVWCQRRMKVHFQTRIWRGTSGDERDYRPECGNGKPRNMVRKRWTALFDEVKNHGGYIMFEKNADWTPSTVEQGPQMSHYHNKRAVRMCELVQALYSALVIGDFQPYWSRFPKSLLARRSSGLLSKQGRNEDERVTEQS